MSENVMMYNEKMVCVLKVDGKVLREVKDTVYIPFGKQYSIFLKNLNNVRAVANITIDGTPVDDSKDGGFVVPANGEIEISRFIKNGNLEKGNKFKFIERTSKIEEHKGIGVEDGLIRIEFQFEKLALKTEDLVKHVYHHYIPSWWHYGWPYYYGNPYNLPTLVYGIGAASINCNTTKSALSNVMRSATGSLTAGSEGATLSIDSSKPAAFNVQAQSLNINTCNASISSVSDSNISTSLARSAEVNEAGITVPGEISEEKYELVSSFALESESHVMVLKLLGETAQGTKVQKAVTVKTKPKCTTCGTTNKATAKFCVDCGTSVILI